MKNLKILIPSAGWLAVVFAIAFTIAFSSANAGSVADGYCPVTTSEKVDSTIFVDYEGQRVYFCCNGCRKDFLADPNKYAANLGGTDTSEMSENSEESHHAAGSDDSHNESTADHHDSDNMNANIAGGNTDDSHNTEADHDHSTDHATDSKFILFTGKFHPIATHFPIALVLTALFLSFVTILTKREELERAGLLLVYLAAPAAVVTVLLGLAAGNGASYPSFLVNYFLWHRALGLTSAGLTIVSAIVGWRWRKSQTPARNWLYRSILALNGIIIGITGHLGATLVFGPDHFTI